MASDVAPSELFDVITPICRKIVGRDYEDAVAGAILKILKAGIYAKPYVKQVARNHCRDILRKRRKESVLLSNLKQMMEDENFGAA